MKSGQDLLAQPPFIAFGAEKIQSRDNTVESENLSFEFVGTHSHRRRLRNFHGAKARRWKSPRL